MGLSNFISENIFLRINDMLTGQSVYSKWQFLQKSQFWSKEEIKSYQDERLRILIINAYENTKYYRNLFDDLKLTPEDIKTQEDLVKLPVLTKKIIKLEGIDKLTSSAIPKRDLMKSSSSGSTGEPLFFYNSKDAYSMNIAASLRGWYETGYRLGDKYIKLSQNSRKSKIKRLQDKVSNNLYLTINPLNESNFELILREIEEFKPKIIRCYPDPLLLIARFKQKNPNFTYQPDAITTTGNTLHTESRIEIENAFGCKVFDSYSCEGNSTVFECSSHACYHSTEEYGISEILDEKNNPIITGIGRLVSTDLWNFAHPFIRYDTQDLIEIDSTPCICGREHLRINKIFGRDNEILIMKTGRNFMVHNFTGFFQIDSSEINRSIDQFQIINMKDGKVVFRLVVNSKFNDTVMNYIQRYWENELKTIVIIEIVKNIPLISSGKREFILNEK